MLSRTWSQGGGQWIPPHRSSTRVSDSWASEGAPNATGCHSWRTTFLNQPFYFSCFFFFSSCWALALLFHCLRCTHTSVFPAISPVPWNPYFSPCLHYTTTSRLPSLSWTGRVGWLEWVKVYLVMMVYWGCRFYK